MFQINGEYVTASVFANQVDDVTTNQIYQIVNQLPFQNQHIAVMPDCHAGKGSCIGFTSTLSDKIIPNVVGVDIGCGMVCYSLPVKYEDFDPQHLDDVIYKFIPSGKNVRDDEYISDKLDREFDILGLDKDLPEKAKALSKKVDQRDKRCLESIGTLGGGNHFIEVDKDDSNNLYMIVHTGSRNLGLCVATYHQNKAIESKPSGVQDEFAYLEGEDKEEYVEDMKVCQKYADANRYVILLTILEALLGKFSPEDKDKITSCIHNYIDFEDNVIRKGAISAHKDENVIIPLNMRDGTILGKGYGVEEWNYSAPHGAGRVLSRTKAKKNISMEKYKDQMKNIWSSCVTESTLDEAPDAYKSADEIVGVLSECIEVQKVIKPVYNFKA